MPLSDWLGGSRREGFAYQLQMIVAQLGLQGRIEGVVGYLQVVARGSAHPLMIALENNAAILRVFSNVRFPPGRPPREVVSALMERSDASDYYKWDLHSNQHCTCFCTCFFLRTGVALLSFTATFCRKVIDEALAEVMDLDTLLTGRCLDRSDVPNHSPRLPPQAPARLPAPESAWPPDDVPAYILDLTRRLLEGPGG
jgi:hypothetical protein